MRFMKFLLRLRKTPRIAKTFEDLFVPAHSAKNV